MSLDTIHENDGQDDGKQVRFVGQLFELPRVADGNDLQENGL
jgi:hypothetical protein